MQNRRQFIKMTSGALALSGISLAKLPFAFAAENLPAPGVQLFTFFNVMDNNVEGTINKVAALGVKNIESAFSGQSHVQPGPDQYTFIGMHFHAAADTITEPVIIIQRTVDGTGVAGYGGDTLTHTICRGIHQVAKLHAHLDLKVLSDVDAHVGGQHDIVEVDFPRNGTRFIIISLPGEDQLRFRTQDPVIGGGKKNACVESRTALVVHRGNAGYIGKIETRFESQLCADQYGEGEDQQEQDK